MIKLNLLFITPVSTIYPGGVERWLKDLSQFLESRGHSVSILQTNWLPHRKSNNISKNTQLPFKRIFTCNYIKIPNSETVIIDPIRVHEILLKIARFEDINLIYNVIYPPNDISISFISRVVKLSAIAGIHFNFPTLINRTKWKLYFPIFLEVVRKYKAVHVLNHNVFSYLRKLGFSSVFFIPNGIDSSKYYVGNSDIFKIYWSGRLTIDKGVDIAINVVKYFNDYYSSEAERKEVLFVFSGIGDKKFETKLKELSKTYSNVKYLGLVPESELPKCYATSHLYLVTSRSEGMPLRVLEATASGLPVVGSNIPGVNDILRATRVGSLVEPHNITAFVKAIRKFFKLWKENPSYYLRLKKAIRNLTIINYDWDVILPRIEKMFIYAIST